MNTEKGESEFGKGLVICLIKFAEHVERWGRIKSDYKKLKEKKSELTSFDEAYAVWLFFNGASDHLYEIEIPAQWENSKLADKVKELQEFGLGIGHNDLERKGTEFDVIKARDMYREIALMIDRELGLEPDIGMW